MIDFHSHILPRIDDGSKSVEESCAMLERLSEQGVSKVVATPHFYANDESVDEFLARRKISYDALKPRLTETMPQIILGAEVKYYQGISRLDNLNKLCAEGSNLLLLEMPMCKWSEYIVKELFDMTGFGNIVTVLAHIDRYVKFQSKATWNRLFETDLLMQVNADFFTGFFSRRTALKMLRNQTVQLIGSDCHNLTDRAPNIGDAYDCIKQKYGHNFIEFLNDYGNNFFNSNR